MVIALALAATHGHIIEGHSGHLRSVGQVRVNSRAIDTSGRIAVV
jgi:hypothetical protein